MGGGGCAGSSSLSSSGSGAPPAARGAAPAGPAATRSAARARLSCSPPTDAAVNVILPSSSLETYNNIIDSILFKIIINKKKITNKSILASNVNRLSL